jgi:trafficking protein particle complex subunit 11
VTPIWIAKHQSRLPAALISFFYLISDPNTSSLRDNQLKSEINNIRSVLASTNYKTKFVVILLAENGPIPVQHLDERIAVLRRATGLDSKTLFFLQYGVSLTEIVEFTGMVLTSLSSFCIEYYRDLSKHARRKRGRSTVPLPTVPPTSGTSQVLPSQGWNVRYEFKLAVFAEFRQEMDAAGRNYEGAYEALFVPELLESISSWSPRFNEARLLADIIALRIIRCQLWTGQTTGAVRSWINHRSRMQDLIDRRGKGTGNYGWEAWEATWSKAMAQLVERADAVPLLPLEPLDPLFRKTGAIFALPEKAVPMGERIAPWEALHHQGYWLRKTQPHIHRRRALALQMPEDDRASPGKSPASVIASKAHLYDTYLTLEPHLEHPVDGQPGYDYSSHIVSNLDAAVLHFSARNQLRTAERIELDIAREHMRSELWEEALTILRPLWSQFAWRQAGWWTLLAEVGWALRACALRTANAETLLSVEWELHNRVFAPHEGHKYDLSQCLKILAGNSSRPAVVIKAEQALSCISARLCFAAAEGHVGEPLNAQLCLQSLSQSGSASIRLTEVKIVFEGSLRSIRLLSAVADPGTESKSHAQLLQVKWRELSMPTDASNLQSPTGGMSPHVGSTSLTIGAGQVKVYDLRLIPREAGDVKVASISLMVDEEAFSLAYVLSKQEDGEVSWWESRNGELVSRRIGRNRDATSIKILPKPPKLQITNSNLRKTYYVNENVTLHMELLNEEEDAAIVSVEARLISPHAHYASIKWSNFGEAISHETSGTDHGFLALPTRNLGALARLSSTRLAVSMTNTLDAIDHEFEITVRYHLESEPETPLNKITTFELPFIRPFEANYDFLCQYDPRPWPNFFESSATVAGSSRDFNKPLELGHLTATGVRQQYALIAKIFSFAVEPVIIEEVVVTTQNVIGGAISYAASPRRRKRAENNGPDLILEYAAELIKPEETQNFEFTIDVQKEILGDRHSVGLDLALHIRWRRADDKQSTMSMLEIPRYLAPMAEPRVLLTAQPNAEAPISGLRHLIFTIENPSMHFLTFSISMESSEDFAFSGPKATNVSLVPLSRHSVEYRMVSLKTNEWIRVNLGVVDAYFGKTLRINPANDFVRSDKKYGVSVWID